MFLTVYSSLSFMCMNMNHQHEPASTAPFEPNQRRVPFFELCLQVLSQPRSPQRIDCLTPTENRHKVFFPKTQRRIVSSKIELAVTVGLPTVPECPGQSRN